MSLELRHVGKIVGRETHIDDVSLALEPGSLNVLLGPTLSGKTSLMRLMAGLDRPSAGQVLVDGRDVTGDGVRKRSVAMVYQQFINYPNLTVYDNIASPLRVAGLARAEVDARVRKAVELLRLDGMLERTPVELSGGQQQRTALARALVRQAALVLLDEPLANLDYKLREELREELPRLFAETGAVLVYATTEPSEALLLGGNTATLHEGRVTQFGPTIEVFRRPDSLATAQIFSDPPMNTLQGEKRGATLSAGALSIPATGSLAGLANGAYIVGFRANHLFLEPPHADAVAVTAEVALTEITGSESFIHVTMGGERWVALAHGVRDLEIGQPVTLYLDPHRFFVFAMDGALAAAPVLASAA